MTIKFEVRQTSLLKCIHLFAFIHAEINTRHEPHDIPLYQNTVPNSWGPFDILHSKLISLPVFTYKSVGPNIIAFNSENKNENDTDKIHTKWVLP